MSRGPHSFKKRDVKRAVEAVMAAGLTVSRVELDRDGRIVVVPGPELTNAANDWDQAIADLESL